MQSFLGSLDYYENWLGETQKQTFRQLDSAVRRVLMTGWGFPAPPVRATKADLDYRRVALAQIPIEKLYTWEIDLEKGFDILGTKLAQRSAIRSHVRKFYVWNIDSGILVDPTRHEEVTKKTPSLMGKGRPPTRRKPCSLTPYRLKEADITASLAAELEAYITYLTARRVEGRQKKKVRKTTAKSHRRHLLEILGWLHHDCEVPLDEMSLSLIVPLGDLKDSEASQAAANYLRGVIDDFAVFLQERGNSSGSIARKISGLTRLIQFQHRGQYIDRHGNDIPVMQVARELITLYEDYSADELDPLLIEGKWLELTDFIQQVTLPAFSLTEFKTRTKNQRAPKAIANSFQEAILWAVFSLMPPRRPGEWRKCKVAMACELSEKPQDLQPGDWVWPLPNSRWEEDELEYSYLTRQYIYQDPATGEKFGSYLGSLPPTDRYLVRAPLWFKDTPRLAAKSGDSHGHQQVLIMDRRVHRDKHIYDFLEAYLMGYWRDRYGNWVSVGKSAESPHSGFQYHELRSCMVPQVNTDETAPEPLVIEPGFLFIGRVKGKSFRCGDFGGKLARLAYKLSGRFVTPHLLRSIYAVHAKDHMNRTALESLAHAMGHTIQTLDNIYDKRRPEQKSRVIEATLVPQLDRICAGLPAQPKAPIDQAEVDINQLRAMLEKLPANQRKLLLAEV